MSRRVKGSNRRGWDDRPGEARSAFFGGMVKLCAFVVLLTLIAMGGIILMPLIEQQRELDAEVGGLEDERDVVLRKRDRVRAELDWLSHDPDYIETVARDELDRFKPGEVVFRIERSGDAN